MINAGLCRQAEIIISFDGHCCWLKLLNLIDLEI